MYKLIRLTKINNSVSCYFHTRSFWHSHPVAQRIKMFTLTIKIKASGNFADDSIVLTIRLILKRNIITIWEIYIYCLEEVRYSLIFSRFLYQSPIFVVIQKKRENIRYSDVVISQTFYQGIVPRHFYPDSFADIARRFF